MTPKARDPAGLSPPAAPVFRSTVHGLAFANRSRHLATLELREELVLIPDPPHEQAHQGQPDQTNADHVWVHLRSGDPLGYLPPEIGRWLAPWIREGGRTRAHVLKVGDGSVPSWRRLLVEVTCLRAP
jgi:hypothetical protein